MSVGIKIASVFFYIYAAISLVWGFSYWYLVGRPHISWPLVGIYLVIALVYVWVGRNLRRGTTVLWIGRILGVLAVLGGLSSLGNNSVFTNHPGVMVLVIARLVIGLVITISLVLPAVGKRTSYSK
jgi:hypothetical protein